MEEILGRLGKENYLEVFLRKIGLRKTNSSLQALLTDEMRTATNSGKLMDIYQSIYGLQNSKEIIDTKIKLRDLIIETVPTDKKRIFLNDFARSTLYDSWNAVKIGTGSVQDLQKKLEEYMKQGVNKELIDILKNAARQENVQKLNNTLEDAKQTIIKTLGEKNLLEEAKKEIHTGTLEDINNTATEVRRGIADGLKNLLGN